MKTIHQLLIDLEVKFEIRVESKCSLYGLCNLILYDLDINSEERNLLYSYMDKHEPFWNFYVRNLLNTSTLHNSYFWRAGRISPRRRWLKKHIRKTKPKN